MKSPIDRHPVVGHFFGGPSREAEGVALFYCDSYDPRIGFWLTCVNSAQAGRINVSERAIGRTFHEAHDRGDHFHVSEWGVKVAKTPAIEAAIDAVLAAAHARET